MDGKARGQAPITFVGGPLEGHQYRIDPAPELYGVPVANGERVAYYRLDPNQNTYNFIGER